MVNRSVIEDYFALTGRPIATLTVEEYLLFLGAGTEQADKLRTSPDNRIEEPLLKSRSSDVQQTPKDAINPQSKSVPVKENNSEAKENSNIRTGSALQMLRSISG